MARLRTDPGTRRWSIAEFAFESTTTPPMTVPCPPINLVAECTTTSAPRKFDRTQQVRCGKGAVDDKRNSVLMGDFSDLVRYRSHPSSDCQEFPHTAASCCPESPLQNLRDPTDRQRSYSVPDLLMYWRTGVLYVPPYRFSDDTI